MYAQEHIYIQYIYIYIQLQVTAEMNVYSDFLHYKSGVYQVKHPNNVYCVNNVYLLYVLLCIVYKIHVYSSCVLCINKTYKNTHCLGVTNCLGV